MKNRSPYKKPILTKYGSVKNLTTGGTVGMGENKGKMGMIPTKKI